jgi:transposase
MREKGSGRPSATSRQIKLREFTDRASTTPMGDGTDIDRIRTIYQAVARMMDERARRHWAAAEAQAYGWGGIRAVSAATGLSPNTIRKGLAELGEGPAPVPRIRRHGGGRKRRTEEDLGLRQALERLLLGDGSGRTSRFSWTCESTTRLATALAARGHTVSPRTVGRLLRDFGYRLDKHRPSSRRPGDQARPDQFKQIAAVLDGFLERGQPVITVTARSEPLLGAEYSKGRTAGQGAGRARSVDSHEMLAARFAVEVVTRWWKQAGWTREPGPAELLLVVDACGSDPRRRRTWRAVFSVLPSRLELPIQICHLPPGITRWGAILTWECSKTFRSTRGRPGVRHEVIVGLIAAEVSDQQMDPIPHDPMPDDGIEGREATPDHSSRPSLADDWNYRLCPSRTRT